jgi:hypothetical protein
MGIMAMVHVLSLAMIKSFVTYHHQLRKRIAKVGGGSVGTQSLKMVMEKQVGGMQRSNGIMCAIRDVSIEGTNYSIVEDVAIAIVRIVLPIFFSQKNL